jgi:hypothetical protein
VGVKLFFHPQGRTRTEGFENRVLRIFEPEIQEVMGWRK